MGAGLVVGFLAFRDAGDGLRVAFGVMVLVLATRELWVMHRTPPPDLDQPPPPIPEGRPTGSTAAMIGAGVIHGIYATGGPLLVYAIGREGLAKHQFRSTLSAIWLVLNAALAVAFLLDGRYDARTSMDLLLLLPAVPLGIVLGEILHHRIDERRFKTVVFALLVAASLSLILR